MLISDLISVFCLFPGSKVNHRVLMWYVYVIYARIACTYCRDYYYYWTVFCLLLVCRNSNICVFLYDWSFFLNVCLTLFLFSSVAFPCTVFPYNLSLFQNLIVSVRAGKQQVMISTSVCNVLIPIFLVCILKS